MSKEAMKLALEAAYLAGFNASGEGYNGEYPFGDKNQNPEADAVWVKDRDNTIREALAEQPAQKRPQNCGTGYCSCIECVMEPAQQEPVAYMDICEKNQMSGLRYWSEPDNRHEVPLYTSPLAQQQAPVAWMMEGWGPDCGPYVEFYRDDEMGWRDRKEWTPLYTSPPQRTWVGLTDGERNHARQAVTYSQLAMTASEWTEAVQIETERRLREKNNA